MEKPGTQKKTGSVYYIRLPHPPNLLYILRMSKYTTMYASYPVLPMQYAHALGTTHFGKIR